MRDKRATSEQFGGLLCDGMTLMIGGFLGVGTPVGLVEQVLRREVRDLTLIVNDAWRPGLGQAKLLAEGRVIKLIVSHIGTNPEVGAMMARGDLDVELVPMGTLAERIRCGGAGLGGVLTPAGLGTLVEQGKRTVEVEGAHYLLETPLRADMALLRSSRCDTFGNGFLHGTSRNMQQVMALAADCVALESPDIVPVGDMDPDNIQIPGVLVDYVVGGERP